MADDRQISEKKPRKKRRWRVFGFRRRVWAPVSTVLIVLATYALMLTGAVLHEGFVKFGGRRVEAMLEIVWSKLTGKPSSEITQALSKPPLETGSIGKQAPPTPQTEQGAPSQQTAPRKPKSQTPEKTFWQKLDDLFGIAEVAQSKK